MESLVILGLAVIGLIVVWPILVPAREAAVVKAQQLEKLAIADDIKFDVKQARNLSKLNNQLDELDEIITTKDLRNKINGKTKKSA